MAWADDQDKMVQMGWGQDKITAAANVFAQHLADQGGTPDDFKDYFGEKPPYDPKPLQDYFSKQTAGAMPNQDPHAEAQNQDTVINAVKSGLQKSIFGVIANQGETQGTVTDNSPWYNKAAQGITQGVADLPFYIPSGAAGAVGGAGVGGPVGAAVGGAAVGMALPQGLRAGLVQAYKQGGINNFSDFWNVAKQAATDAGKGALTGVATMGAGKLGGAIAQDLAKTPFAQKAADMAGSYVSDLASKALPFASEVAGMTAAGSALEGKMPNASDFFQNAVTTAGLHGATHVQEKLMNTFSDTGIHPQAVTSEAQNDPILKQELLSSATTDTPRSLAPMKEATSENSTHVVVDGHLVPGEEAAKQGHLNFNGTPGDFADDAESRFHPDEQEKAARASDPAAFRQLEDMQKQFKTLNDQIANHQGAIDAIGSQEEPITPAKNLEVNDRVKAMKDTQANIDELKNSDSMKALQDRIKAAFDKGHETLTNNLKDRLLNANLNLGKVDGTELHNQFNPDFNQPGDHIPDMETATKQGLVNDPQAIEAMKGANADFTSDDGLNKVLQSKPDVGYSVAPDLFEKEIGSDKVKPKALKMMSGKVRDNKPQTGFMLEKAMFNKINAWDQVYRNSSDPAIKNMPVVDRVSNALYHAQESGKRALGVVKDGVFDKEGNLTSEGLNPIYDKYVNKKTGNVTDAKQYVIYKQVLVDNAKGIATGVPSEEAQSFVDANKQYETFAQKHQDLNNALLDYSVEHGKTSKALADQWKKDDYFTPSYRTDEEGYQKSGMTAGKNPNAFQTKEGSELPYRDPYEAMQTKIANVMRSVDLNNARQQILELNESLPADEKLGASFRVEKDAEGNQEEAFTKEWDGKHKLQANQVPVYINGEPHFMTLKDPDLARFAGGGSGEAKNADSDTLDALKFLSKNTLELPARLTRTGASLSSSFTVAHIIRAEGFSWFVSNRGPLGLGRLPFIDTMRAIPDVMKNTDVNQEALRAGAFDGMITPLDNPYGDNNKYMADDKYGNYSATQNTIKSLWGINHELINVWTKAQRLSEYKALRADNPDASFEDLQNIGATARRVTVDAMRTGAAMNFLSKYIPFYQYEVQGAKRGFDALQENTGNSVVKLGLIGVLSGLAAMAGKGHQKVEEQSAEMKKNYWLLPSGNIGDGVIRIPKPWGVEKAVANLFEDLYHATWEKNPEAYGDMASDMLEPLSALVPKLPSSIEAGLVMHSNFNTYTGRSYMNDSQMKLAPEARAMPYTSETARLAAKGIGNLQGLPVIGGLVKHTLGDKGLNLNSAPIADYAIRQFGGTQGQLAVKGIDAGLATQGLKPPVAPPTWQDDPSQLPYIGALMARNPTYNSASYTAFNEAFKDVEQKYNTYNDYAGNSKHSTHSDPVAAEKYLQENPEIDMYKDMKDAKKSISQALSEIHDADTNPDYSNSDKKQATEDRWKPIIAIAREQLNNLEEIKKGKR